MLRERRRGRRATNRPKMLQVSAARLIFFLLFAANQGFDTIDYFFKKLFSVFVKSSPL